MEQLTAQQSSDVLRTLIRRFWIIVLGLILGGALGALVSQQMTPVYQSSVYLLVVPAYDRVDTSINDDIERRLRNDYAQAFSRLTTEPAVIGEAVRESGVGVDPEGIEEAVNVTVSPNNPILQIVANFRDPEAAATLANALGSGLSSFTEESAEDTGYRAEVMAEASPAGSPSAPGWKLNIAVGAAAGLLVGGVMALFWDGLRQPWEAWVDQRRARRIEKVKQRAREKAELEEILRPRPESRLDEPPKRLRRGEKDEQHLIRRLRSLPLTLKVGACAVAIVGMTFGFWLVIS